MLSLFKRLFVPSAPEGVTPQFDASVSQRLAAAGKDATQVQAVAAEAFDIPPKPVLVGFEGTVKLELTLDAQGKVVGVQMEGAPFTHVGDLEAWAHQWRFTPAMLEGQAHPCRMVFEVSWSTP